MNIPTIKTQTQKKYFTSAKRVFDYKSKLFIRRFSYLKETKKLGLDILKVDLTTRQRIQNVQHGQKSELGKAIE